MSPSSVLVFEDSPSHACQQVISWADQLVAANPMLLDKVKVQLLESGCGDAEQGIIEMLKFLVLCSLSLQTLTPSTAVDRVWHEFILFTRSYAEFCDDKFQRFIHHQPSNQPGDEARQYHATIEFYQRIFGELNRQFWPLSATEISECGLCQNGIA